MKHVGKCRVKGCFQGGARDPRASGGLLVLWGAMARLGRAVDRVETEETYSDARQQGVKRSYVRSRTRGRDRNAEG